MPRILKHGISAETAAEVHAGIRATVETLLADIKQRGDAAVREMSAKFDKWDREDFRLTDAEIRDAYAFAARCEGIFCEPASAASIAGLRKRARGGGLRDVRRVVCVLTGNGMKDPESARSLAGPIPEVDATTDAVRRALA